MDSPRTAPDRLTPEAAEFVRFCYRRRPVGWPELYDEMCAVAGRGLFNGWGPAELAEHGVGFSLFETPALAALVSRILAEEQPGRHRQRPMVATVRAEARPALEASEPGTIEMRPKLAGAAAG